MRAPRSSTRELLPDWLIRPAAVTASACSAVVAALGSRYAAGRAPAHIDQVVSAVIRRTIAVHPHVLHLTIRLAYPDTVLALVSAMVVAALSMRLPRAAILALTGPCVSVAITEFVLKPLFDRTLHGMPVFPSGHATAVASVNAVLAVLVLGAPPPQRLFPGLMLVATGLCAFCASAVAMVGLGYHYATDILAGFCVAFAVVPAVAFVIDKAMPDKSNRKPPRFSEPLRRL